MGLRLMGLRSETEFSVCGTRARAGAFPNLPGSWPQVVPVLGRLNPITGRRENLFAGEIAETGGFCAMAPVPLAGM